MIPHTRGSMGTFVDRRSVFQRGQNEREGAELTVSNVWILGETGVTVWFLTVSPLHGRPFRGGQEARSP